jgi:2-keto-4-pentenoate hydratase/2-oxohepta-3-ene-1,7-dioic acid hydratase in catechol pathway
MVAYASLGERVFPGELLSTGTIPGCSGMETGQWLSPGDEIELEIEGIGTLRNVIGSPAGRVGTAP